MDPDIPLPSTEGGESSVSAPDTTTTTATWHPLVTDRSDATTPKTPKSKSRSPPKTQTPISAPRSPSVASARSERQSSPALRARQSLNNLKSPRSGTPQMAQFRRASSNLNPASPITGQKNGTMHTGSQHKPLTPNEVAKTFFAKELDQQQPQSSEVVVIVHDSCYGHRFSRPKTSKASLGLIVERPERIQATLLGASLAYVRLGGRHVDGDYPPHPQNTTPAHTAPFHIHKTNRNMSLNHAAVTAVHGSKWMEELQIMCDTAEAKLAMNGKELVRPIGYGKDENGKSLPKLHEGDLYLCSESLAALQGCLGGVCEAIDTVFAGKTTKRAFVCIRPPGHHCSADFPSGFCWLNNVHVGVKYAAMQHGLTHAAIIDFDLHHGDGSQMIAWNHNTKAKELPHNAAAHKRTPVGYYSLHDINSYPCEWGDEDKIRNASVCIENAHGLSIWNVHLEEWNDHAEFWKLYETRYLILLEKTRKFLKHHSAALRGSGTQPKAAIFLSAGFDASEWEGAGMQRHGVNVPTDFYARFTSDIVKLSQEDGLGVDGRLISVLEGGYSDRALASGVLSHVCGLVDEPASISAAEQSRGLGASMSGFPSGPVNTTPVARTYVQKYDSSWWNVHSLETIEAIVAGRLPPSKDNSDRPQGNYSSPTQASNAKMTQVARERRSLNAEMEARLSLIDRPPPPPPDVEWEIAAYELSRIIIPNNRQIASCRHDELNAEATRARKERQSGIGVAGATSAEPMQLRERKVKVPPLPAAAVRSSSRTRSESRRTTIASFNDLPDPNEPVPPLPSNVVGRPRRRSSAGSSIVSGLSDMKLNDVNKDSTISTGATTAQSITNERGVKENKTTAARKPRTVATKPPAPTKVPARKAAPALSRQTSNSSDKASTVLQQTSSNQSRQASTNSDASADMDTITVGLKKIKLKMPTREQHNENQKKHEEELQPKNKPKTTRKLPESRVPKAKPAPKGPSGFGVPAPPPKEDKVPDTKLEEPSTRLDSLAAATKVPPVLTQDSRIESHAQPTSSIATTTTAEPSAFASNESTHNPIPVTNHGTALSMMPPPLPFHNNTSISDTTETIRGPATFSATPEIPSQQNPVAQQVEGALGGYPHAHPAPVGIPSANAWHFVTPAPRPLSTNGSRPVTPQKHQLPKFTSTSPIPFANSKSNTDLPENAVKQENSGIWDIPDTPR